MKIRIFLPIFITAISVLSCTKDIDFDLNEEQERIVIDGFITNVKQKHLIKITRTTSFFKTYEEAPAAENANVVLSDGVESYLCIEETPGNYYTRELAFELEKNYTLTIDYKGKTYTASDYMNSINDIDSIETFESEDLIFGDGKMKLLASIAVFVRETEGIGDYYLWKYQVKKPDTAYKDMTPTFTDWIFFPDEFVEGKSPPDGWVFFDRIPTSEIVPGSIVRLQMFGISKGYYDFLVGLRQQVFRGGLFDGPQANISTNFDNGALGYFVAASEDIAFTTKE
jgi:hypothetical protein|tara:strand:+ start:17349 stop:18197 length:849 start_codon:yes stop_codon:yes gene_type:complete